MDDAGQSKRTSSKASVTAVASSSVPHQRHCQPLGQGPQRVLAHSPRRRHGSVGAERDGSQHAALCSTSPADATPTASTAEAGPEGGTAELWPSGSPLRSPPLLRMPSESRPLRARNNGHSVTRGRAVGGLAVVNTSLGLHQNPKDTAQSRWGMWGAAAQGRHGALEPAVPPSCWSPVASTFLALLVGIHLVRQAPAGRNIAVLHISWCY